MIFGIGVDIVQIARIQESIDGSGDKLAEKILADSELKEYHSSPDKAGFLAKRFAAKEAFAKALGTGLRNGITFKQIRVDHNEIGRPVLILTDQAKYEAEKLNIRHCHLSLSDEKDNAIAFVTLEGRIRHNH